MGCLLKAKQAVQKKVDPAKVLIALGIAKTTASGRDLAGSNSRFSSKNRGFGMLTPN